MKSKLKVPKTKRMTLKYENLLSSFAVNFNLGRYNMAKGFAAQDGMDELAIR